VTGSDGPRPGTLRAGVAAAMDVGSNSVHLLVAGIEKGGLRRLLDVSTLLGLGEIVDREGVVPADAREALVATIGEYVSVAEAHGAERITLLGTEPLRRARDRAVVEEEVRRATTLPLHVIDHRTEAYLTLLGVTGGVSPDRRLLVADIGGGSTEIVIAGGGRPPAAAALASGSARLTSAFVRHDPPTLAELEALRHEAVRLVAGLPPADADEGIMVGGTASNIVKLLPGAEAAADLTMLDLDATFALLGSAGSGAIVERFGVNLRRARQLAAGAALVEAIGGRYGLDRMGISDASLRDGAILAVAHAGDEWRSRLGDLVSDVS
jgi:exopolyphosphatase/pppGpp-phosphohydrolase